MADRRTSPALRAASVLVLGLGLGGLAWLGWRQLHQQACEKASQTNYHVASYDDRLQLRELSRAPVGAQDDGQSRWGEIRPRLDDHEREWTKLRTRACVEGHTALARCLDHQAGALAVRINAWVHGDPSWATDNLDDAIPAPSGCLGQLGG